MRVCWSVYVCPIVYIIRPKTRLANTLTYEVFPDALHVSTVCEVGAHPSPPNPPKSAEYISRSAQLQVPDGVSEV